MAKTPEIPTCVNDFIKDANIKDEKQIKPLLPTDQGVPTEDDTNLPKGVSIAFDENGLVLLSKRQGSKSGYHFPRGKAKTEEESYETARRELWEESE